MARRKSRTFTLERLEAREVPAIFGIPWADHRVTLSFAPDGTDVNGRTSELGRMFQRANLTDAQGQHQILRAVQAWVQQADVRVRTVADAGQPIGTAGYDQGDARFGDIRVSARPLGTDVFAITTPSGQPGETRSGDIIFNSNVQFRVGGTGGPDLFTAALQEAGHAFGVANSTDPNSAMYEQYVGPRTGLTAGDVANIRTLYGVRPADRFEGTGRNDTLATGTTLGVGTTSLVVKADLNQAQDVDFYKFTTPAAADADGFAVWLQSKGRSLAAARLTVLTAAGATVASMAATSPNASDLTLQVLTATPNTTYFVKVEGNSGTDFRVGDYLVKVVFDPNAAVVESTIGLTVVDDAATNEVIGKATVLAAASGQGTSGTSGGSTVTQTQLQYVTAARLRSATDVDFYRMRAPQIGKNQANVATITITSMDGSAIAPRVLAFDDKKVLLTSQVIASDATSVTVQLENLKSDKDVYLSVAGATAGVYLAEINFRSQVINRQTYASGTLSASAPSAVRKMQVAQSQLVNFQLAASAMGMSTVTGVRLRVFDSANREVYSLFARAGQPMTGTALLTAGHYTLVVTAGTSDGSALASTNFILQGVLLSDPIGTGSTGSDGTTDVQPIVTTPTSGEIDQILTILPVIGPWL